jgi:hypothetical protein
MGCPEDWKLYREGFELIHKKVWPCQVKKFLTNIKLKGINKLIHIYMNKEGGWKIMSCGMKHPKPKKTTKKATSKKKK